MLENINLFIISVRDSIFSLFIFLILFMAIYYYPFIQALKIGKSYLLKVFFLNSILGWTIIGWGYVYYRYVLKDLKVKDNLLDIA